MDILIIQGYCLSGLREILLMDIIVIQGYFVLVDIVITVITQEDCILVDTVIIQGERVLVDTFTIEGDHVLVDRAIT